MRQELIFDAGKETLHWAGSLRRAPFAWSAFGFLVLYQSSIVLVGDSMQHSYLLEGSLLFSF